MELQAHFRHFSIRSTPSALIAILDVACVTRCHNGPSHLVFTFMPVILIKNYRIKRKLKWAQEKGDEELVKKIQNHMVVHTHRQRLIFFHILLVIPVVIFWATILASMERTPLTGRSASTSLQAMRILIAMVM